MIYLIHFDKPVRSAKHYLGFCRDDRLDARMLEHARGEASHLTRAAVNNGTKLWLARTFEGGNRDLERTMKRHGHFKLMCPLCCPLFERLKVSCYEIDAKRQPVPPRYAVLDWRGNYEFPS